MSINIEAKVHNRFDIEVRDAKTKELKQKAQAENIILNQAWASILDQRRTNLKWFSAIAYGTGTGTLSATRTALFTNLGNKAATTPTFFYDSVTGTYSLRQQISILENEHVGSILTEVGIWDTHGAKLMTHALLKDMNGNTVSITKTDTDILYIYATTYLVIVADKGSMSAIDVYRSDGSENGLISSLLGYMVNPGTEYPSCETFPTRIAWRGGDFEGPSLNVLDNVVSGTAAVTIDVANKKATIYYRLPAASGNVSTGLKSFTIECYRSDYARTLPALRGHLPSINHTQADITEQIGIGDGVSIHFETAFPFVKSGAVIRVDGTPVTASVITGVPNQKEIKWFMINKGKDNGFMSTLTRITAPQQKEELILENPFFGSYGIDTMKVSRCVISCRNAEEDSWVQVYTTAADDQIYTVAAGDKQKRYWRFAASTAYGYNLKEINCDALDNLKNVTLATPPANASIITATYGTDTGAKDINHVLDLTIVIQFAEYTP